MTTLGWEWRIWRFVIDRPLSARNPPLGEDDCTNDQAK